MATVQKTELSDQFALLVEAVQKYGISNISQISRQTGIPIETVRYKIKKQLPSFGIGVRMRFDENRLGLRLFFAELEFAEGIEQYASKILMKLHEVGFVSYHARELNSSFYTTHFMVPFGLMDEWKNYLDKLMNLKILRNYWSKKITWRRIISVNPHFFDFAGKKWIIDISRKPLQSESILSPQVDLEGFLPDTGAINIDRIDLLIIKEMQKDAAIQLSKMSKVLKLNEKTVGYHYRRHVRPLAPQTYFAWVADSQEERSEVMMLRFVFTDLVATELFHCRRVFNSFPFTWSESGDNNGFYVVDIAFPLKYYAWAMDFLRTELASEYSKAKVILLDSTDAVWYTIPYHLFDENNGGWFFEEPRAVKGILDLLPQLESTLKKK